MNDVSRRSFLTVLLAGTAVGVAGAYVPLRERQRQQLEAWPSRATFVEIPRDGNWHHIMVLIDRSGPSKTWLNGRPYTTWIDKIRYKLTKMPKDMIGFLNKPIPPKRLRISGPVGFRHGAYYKAVNTERVDANDTVVEHIFHIKNNDSN